MQRTKTGPSHIDGADFLAFASASTLYGNNFRGISTMTVDSTGVTVDSTTSFTVGSSLIFENNLLYGSLGQVLNPSTGEIVGTFSGMGFGAIQAVDSANGRVFFLAGNGFNLQLRAFDINTFLPLGFVNVFGVNGTPTSLVRWGTNGLAFRTSSRQVFLIETALVNSSVPVASPTPTPSPTPSPSPPYIPTFTRRVNLPANNLVYSDATQALYASVPSTAGPNGNSITKITPATGDVGPSTFIGSEPNKIAISSDGQTLWVHLNGANAARRFDISSQSAGLQFTTNLQSPSDMEVVPGSPQSLVISTGFSNGVAVYDDGVKRPNTSGSFPSVGPIEFGSSASVLYGFNNFSSGADVVKYLIDSSGLTTSTTTGALLTGNTIEFSNGRLYSGGGRVADPESQTLVGTFVGTGFFSSAMTVDGPNNRVFYLFPNGSSLLLTAFDSNTFLPIGSITLPNISGTPVSLVRWGVNGLAFNTSPSFFGSSEPSQIFLLQTELVSKAVPIPIGLQLESDKNFTFESVSTLQVKVARTGDVSGTTSVDFATSNGTATAGSDYTAASGTLTFAPGELSKNISIPILDNNLFENGNETFTLTLSNPTGAAILLAPPQRQ